MRVTPRELKDLYAKAKRLGCDLTQTKGGHIQVRLPDQGPRYFGPATASDPRSVRNVRAGLRRMGLDL